MSDENVEREKSWSEFVSNNGLTYAAEQQLRVAFIGGWVRGRASRPREAKCPACGGVGEHVEGKRGFTRFPCPNAAPPVAPEACPMVWTIIYEDPSHPHEAFTGAGAEHAARARYEQASIAWNCHLMRSATPASAPAEGGGGTCALCGGDRNSPRKVDALQPGMKPQLTAYVVPCPAALHATPTSATGRDVAVEKARQAFYEAARALAEVIDDHCCEPESRSAAKASATCGEREFAFKEAHNALLAAEAAERGEKEA